MDIQQITEPAASKVGQVLTHSGGGLAIWFAMNAQIVAAVGGIVIGIVGLFITWYYKHQHLKLAQQKAQEWTPLGDGE